MCKIPEFPPFLIRWLTASRSGAVGVQADSEGTSQLRVT
jgi:hypothetical protein